MKNRKLEICTSGSVRDEAGQPPHLLGRRQFLHLAAGAAALPAVSRIASALDYPTRPVHFVVAFAPGGTADILAVFWVNGCRNGSGSRSSWRTGRALAPISAPSRSSGPLLMAIRSSSLVPRTRSTGALRKSQFQFHPRYCASRKHQPWGPCHGGGSVVSGEVRFRVHCLRQSQSWQAQLRVRRHWNRDPCFRRLFKP